MPSSHVYVKHDKLVVLFLASSVVWNGNGERAFFRVVNVRVSSRFFVRLEAFSFLKAKVQQ